MLDADKDCARRDAVIAVDGAVSDWILVDQAMIDSFADVTGDRQFIHIDPVRAGSTSYGGTIAHGFLLLSLIPQLKASMANPRAAAASVAVNYGGNKVRFLAAVRAGSRIRARSRLVEEVEKQPGAVLQTVEYMLEVEGGTRPALLAEWITLYHV